jgi:hypothetical protein
MEKAPASGAEPLLAQRARPSNDTPTLRAVDNTPAVRPVDKTPVTRLADNTPVGGPVGSTPVGRPVDNPPAVAHPVGNPSIQEPRNDQRPSDIPARPDGSAPLVPHGENPIVAWAEDFSLPPDSQPSVVPADLPPFVAPATAENKPDPAFASEIPVPAPIFFWTSMRPTLLVIPEPGSGILLGASLAALGALRRSRRRE